MAENKRIPRLNRLLTIANRAAGASVGMSVDVEAFNRLVPDDLKARIGGCYGLNVRAALAKIKRFAKDLGWDEPIQVVLLASGIWRDGRRHRNWGYMDEEEIDRFVRKNVHLVSSPRV